MFSHPRISLLAAHIANRRRTWRPTLSAADRAQFQLHELKRVQRHAVSLR
jgi:hypothetical protein